MIEELLSHRAHIILNLNVCLLELCGFHSQFLIYYHTQPDNNFLGECPWKWAVWKEKREDHQPPRS